ncbi:BREX system ATP-binding protein BrxD [Rhodococcus sp. BP-252]|uniref:BREX system ATP-binding protein BrxD n=1 Tax=unclassified Rhodococcus (in: high G+C Gram-positive bacteria) TaxID=192944 RepID=UPI001C9A8FB8|nr:MULTISPECIES: BREX system ATP-binding protein BrxD [unclassified Rhodococcus (in: high G+C Gram-positive bacteria)]MBY6413362.1 BREX system ATP-binding protein BrxD [Rhodococcus sp. BP-320]MBY6418034.1 BREX system ATP-binding protein BrxD [Rhodococcus sp. BP-321]MBY6422276.1 BREX system ATP-binding protein BrxD [Rhodococcus sp. BP-324]MBY6428083.1 BREX system ATP-binding protein BrxD [Rhodococcus sp. BP-323]MBY6433283.1 BREX system ATP-binding protein BrxD [Rhodococcus sp. BP-322]
MSPRRRREILDALRRGTVPSNGLDQLAVGLGRFETELDAELAAVAGGGAMFKAVRGDYGSGKTFFARWLADRATKQGFAIAEVQVNEIDTPLHKLETVYRRSIESLRTASIPPSALRPILDAWLFTIEDDAQQQGIEVDSLLERRLADVATRAPVFPMAIRAYRRMIAEGDNDGADGLVAWLGGQPHVAASVKRRAGIKGDLDHFLALGFLRGLLAVLADAGNAGLLLVLDEVETLQRVRRDARAKALNALRQLVDEVHDGHFPGLYLLITGTPAFFEGRQGVALLPPLADRLHTDFSREPRFDNPRAPQLRLTGFDLDKLVELGGRVRELFVSGIDDADRVRAVADDQFLRRFADAVAGKLGGRVGIAPRLFLRKLIDVLDVIELHPDFDPYTDYEVSIAATDLLDGEREAVSADDVELDI